MERESRSMMSFWLPSNSYCGGELMPPRPQNTGNTRPKCPGCHAPESRRTLTRGTHAHRGAPRHGSAQPFVGTGTPCQRALLNVRPAVVIAYLEDLHDVGVLQPGHHFTPRAEAVEPFGAGVHAGLEHLDGHYPVRGRLARLVDHVRRAAAQLRQDLITRISGYAGAAGAGRRRPLTLEQHHARREAVDEILAADRPQLALGEEAGQGQ